MLSQAVNPASASAIQVNSVRAGGKKTGTFSTTGNTILFTPNAAFLPGETVQVTVPGSVQSATGATAAAHWYQFTTGVDGFGGGTFEAPAVNPDPGVDSGPGDLVLGDIDGDGDLDLLTCSFGGTGLARINVRINSGLNSANFVPSAVNASFSNGQTPGSTRMVLGDIDGDGDLDLVASANNSELAIRLNDGINSGNFVSPSTGSSVAVGSFPLDIALADADGDGDLDAFAANAGSNTVSIRLNSGLNTGVFTVPASNAEALVGTSPTQLLLGDIDNDGDVDMLAVCAGNTLSLRMNSGLNSGVFVAPAANATISAGNFLNKATLGDVNGDGYLDLVLTKSGTANNAEVWLNTRSNAFTFYYAAPVGIRPQAVVLGDIDGDGDLDMLVGNDNRTNTVSLRLNGGFNSGLFVEPIQVPEPAVGSSFPWSVALGDVNGDGNLDVLSANNNNSGSGPGGGVGKVSVRLNQTSALRTVLTPTLGAAGATIMLRGTDVTGASTISFNGLAAPAGSFSVVSPTTLRVTVPNGATTGPVTVTTPRGVLTSSTRFVVATGLAAHTGQRAAKMNVFPNPAHEQLTIDMAGTAGGATVQVRLLDALGRTVKSQRGELLTGQTSIQIELAHIPDGVYSLHLQVGEHRENHRVVIN